jgi:6-pyruvoyltetrahydropterin/6-carboxytetrahydropterin synthase
MLQIYRRITFEAAHRLPQVPEGHPCGRMHGHSYSVELHARGEMDPKTGWIFDLAEIDQAFAPLHAQLDHHCLNEIEGLSNPTSEHLAIWIWKRLKPTMPNLCKVVVSETPNSGCIYEG